jgi:hypothetical protein
MSYSRTTYTGPVKNRGEDDQGRALVSREELADFRRKYGADKTLRDLLNADRTGKLPSSAENTRARGVQGANTAPSGRAEIPTGGTARAPASTGKEGMSDTTRNVLNTLQAIGPGVGQGLGAAIRGARAIGPAGRATEAERLASRIEPRLRRSGESVEESVNQARMDMAREPRLRRSGESVDESVKQARAEMAREPRMRRSGESVDESVSQARAEMAREPRMRRSGESVDEAMKQARTEMAREPRLEPARAMSAAEKKAPAVQGDKAKTTPRSRTRDEEDGEFKKGGKVKAYAKGGSVRGAGIAQRGVKPCKVC